MGKRQLRGDLRPDNIIVGQALDFEEWPESAPRFVKNDKSPFLVLFVLALTLFTVWHNNREKKARAAARAELLAGRADLVFGLLDRALPRRLTIEELGDAHEEIGRYAKAGACWFIYKRTVTTVWRVLKNALLYSLDGY
jgi:hypothetical protein